MEAIATANRSVEETPPDASDSLERLALEIDGLLDSEPETKRADALADAIWRTSRLGNEHAAQVLAAAAEKSSLAQWKTTEGDDLRAIAVEALIEMGHPYALFVPPEALVEVRRNGRALRQWHTLARLTTLGAGLSAGVAAAAATGLDHNDLLPSLVLLGLVAALAGFADHRAEKEPRSVASLVTFLVLALGQAALTAFLEGPGAVASGVSAGLFLLTLLIHALEPAKRP